MIELKSLLFPNDRPLSWDMVGLRRCAAASRFEISLAFLGSLELGIWMFFSPAVYRCLQPITACYSLPAPRGGGDIFPDMIPPQAHTQSPERAQDISPGSSAKRDYPGYKAPEFPALNVPLGGTLRVPSDGTRTI